MKFSIAKYLVVPLAMFLSCAPALGQTPDGLTPANEGICDELRNPGVTKGLYGLCIAYCEAQDLDLSEPMASQDLEAVLLKTPSIKILRNYNRKKSPYDPEMPCLNVVDPCPCEIDGIFDSINSGATNTNICLDQMQDAPVPDYNGSTLETNGITPNFADYVIVYHFYDDNYVAKYGEYYCVSRKYRSDPYEWTYSPVPDLTEAEALGCVTLIRDTAALHGIECQ